MDGEEILDQARFQLQNIKTPTLVFGAEKGCHGGVLLKRLIEEIFFLAKVKSDATDDSFARSHRDSRAVSTVFRNRVVTCCKEN